MKKVFLTLTAVFCFGISVNAQNTVPDWAQGNYWNRDMINRPGNMAYVSVTSTELTWTQNTYKFTKTETLKEGYTIYERVWFFT